MWSVSFKRLFQLSTIAAFAHRKYAQEEENTGFSLLLMLFQVSLNAQGLCSLSRRTYMRREGFLSLLVWSLPWLKTGFFHAEDT